MLICCVMFLFFFFKQKTAYEMRISDWSSDVCSSDLADQRRALDRGGHLAVLDQVGLRGREHELAAGDVDLAAAEIDGVEAALHRGDDLLRLAEIGRASCRESVCQYVEISVVAGSLKKKKT